MFDGYKQIVFSKEIDGTWALYNVKENKEIVFTDMLSALDLLENSGEFLDYAMVRVVDYKFDIVDSVNKFVKQMANSSSALIINYDGGVKHIITYNSVDHVWRMDKSKSVMFTKDGNMVESQICEECLCMLPVSHVTCTLLYGNDKQFQRYFTNSKMKQSTKKFMSFMAH